MSKHSQRATSAFVAWGVVLAAVAGGCSGDAATINADTRCDRYLDFDRDERYDASVRLTSELRTSDPGNPMWALTLDSACGANRTSTIGEILSDTAPRSAGSAPSTTTSAAPTPEPGSAGSGSAPTVTVTGQPAPRDLVTSDLRTGTGPAVTAGETAVVNYVGATYVDGKTFESTWGKDTFSFQVGAGAVIAGWDLGVPGMKVGGRRQLVIPADLAYGDMDKGDGRPYGTLVFIIDLVAIN